MIRKHLNGRTLNIAAGIFAALLITLAAVKTYEIASKHLPISRAQLHLAQTGVSQNTDWIPIIRQFNGLDWALVPAGCFDIGSDTKQLEKALLACKAFSGENCTHVFDLSQDPDSQVCFKKPYWINATEITNRQYGTSFEANEDVAYPMIRQPNWPRDTITWRDAAEFCKNNDARLPSESEWEYAARGPDGLIFLWGNEPSPAYQNEAWRLSPQTAGSFTADISWVGARGLTGNVAEWVEDIFDPSSTQVQVKPHMTQEEMRIARGGSWASYADFLLRTVQRIPYDPEHASSLIGFRCVRDFDQTP